MKRIIQIATIVNILFLSTVWIGCTSSNNVKENQYKNVVIDSVLKNNNGEICARLTNIGPSFYRSFNILTFSYYNSYPKNNDTIKYIVISSKENKDSIDFNEYEEMKVSKEYCIGLTKEYAPIRTSIEIRGKDLDFFHFLDVEENLLFYKKGNIVMDVYKSKDIKGIYVTKEKRKHQ
ncbi:MAG: hypothetical protein ACOYN6_01465 [Ignavibacteria bacterium]